MANKVTKNTTQEESIRTNPGRKKRATLDTKLNLNWFNYMCAYTRFIRTGLIICAPM